MSAPEKVRAVSVNIPCDVTYYAGEGGPSHRAPDYVTVSACGLYASVYCAGGGFDAARAKALTKARKELADKIARAASDKAADDRDCYRSLIACADGTMIIVQRERYSITRAGLRNGSSCLSSGQSYDQMMEAARRHADQSYGGVAWESML